MRRFAAATSVSLFLVLSVAVAEAGLLFLILVFSSVLNVNVSIELGNRLLQAFRFSYWPGSDLSMTVQAAGTVGSWLITAGAGLFAAAWQLRRWRPPA